MAAIKSHQAPAFLKKPDAAITAILVFGTDAGLVTERAKQAADTWAKLEDPPGDVLRIDDPDLETDPDRLSVELGTLPMFGGRKVVRTTLGRRVNADLLKPLVAEGPLPATLVVEAGNLKPTDALRKLFEKEAHAAALACYPDEGRDISGVIREVMTAHGLRIAPDAEDLLVARLGADRGMSRGEIDKLALYCMDRQTIEAEDVDAIVGDASELAMDRIVMAASGADGARALREFTRASISGESPQAVIAALQRHFIKLHRVQAEVSAGRSVGDALKTLRPPLHFKQRDAFSAQIRAWSGPRLTKALATISEAALQARRSSDIDHILTERLLLLLARMAAPARVAR